MKEKEGERERERERERSRGRGGGEMRVLATLASIYGSECSSFRFMFVINRVSGSLSHARACALTLAHTRSCY